MKYCLAIGALILSGCATTLETEKHAALTGEARNEMASKTVKVLTSDQSMDKFFSGPRELKNACIVGVYNNQIVNDNTANHKSEMEYQSGPNMRTRLTTTFSYTFKPSPAYFQTYTDYAYDALASTLRAYGYNVLEPATVLASAAYQSKGDKGNTTYDKNPQYSGYFNVDAKGLRRYDGNGYSAVRLLSANDTWATQFHKETNCELMVNATMVGHWKVARPSEVDGINALVIDAENHIKLDWYTPWPVWEKASKEVKSKIYGAINRGGNTSLKSFPHQDLIFATGDNSKVPQDKMDRMALNTDAKLRNSLAMAIEYQVRAFHLEAYKAKQIPATLSSVEVREPASSSNE